MTNNALHLRDNRAHIFRTFRNLHANEFFYRTYIRVVISHRAGIVQSIRMRDHLHVMQAFSQFFHTAMKIAHIRHGFRNSLPIEFQNNSQHPMRTGMLRAHIQQHFCCTFGTFRSITSHELMSLIIRNFRLRPFACRLIQPW